MLILDLLNLKEIEAGSNNIISANRNRINLYLKKDEFITLSQYILYASN